MTSTRLRYPRMLPVCVAICLTAGQCFAAAGAPELPDPGKPRMTRDEQKQLGLQVAQRCTSKCLSCLIPVRRRNIYKRSANGW